MGSDFGITLKNALHEVGRKEIAKQQDAQGITSPINGSSNIGLKDPGTVIIGLNGEPTESVKKGDSFTSQKLEVSNEVVDDVKKEAGAAAMAGVDGELEKINKEIANEEKEMGALLEGLKKYATGDKSVIKDEEAKAKAEGEVKAHEAAIANLNKAKNAYSKIMTTDLGQDPKVWETLLGDIPDEYPSIKDLCKKMIDRKKADLKTAQAEARAREISAMSQIARPNDKQMESIKKLVETIKKEMEEITGVKDAKGNVLDENGDSISPELKAKIIAYKNKQAQVEKLQGIIDKENKERSDEQQLIARFYINKEIPAFGGHDANSREALEALKEIL